MYTAQFDIALQLNLVIQNVLLYTCKKAKIVYKLQEGSYLYVYNQFLSRMKNLNKNTLIKV